MFEQLTERLQRAFKHLSGQVRFTEENTHQAFRDIRVSLLEADVALPVVREFIDAIKQKTLGTDIDASLKADQALIKIVNEELIRILGDTRAALNFSTQPPAVFLMAGLQGSGKTTSTAKLARYLKDTEKKKVMLVSVDVYRPAAIDQLKRLAEQVEVAFFPSSPTETPVDIVKKAWDSAKKQYMDVLIVDTAGRLHVDTEMMDEIKALHHAVNPVETLFVVDSMTGQDAVNTAKAFNEALPLTGVILTKTDGDARGGVALSVKYITGHPVKFIGTGEKLQALEPFHPDRMASRILGMGDMLSLIEDMERKADKQTQERLVKKIKKGQGFDLNDFKQQLIQMNSLGGVAGLMGKLPGMANLPPQAMVQGQDNLIKKTIAIINSMTDQEKSNPRLIQASGSRKRRIAKGSASTIQEVVRVLKQHEQMQKAFSKMAKPGAMKQMMRGLGGLPGLKNMLPPGIK